MLRVLFLGVTLLVACSEGSPTQPTAPAPPGVWSDTTGTVAFNYGAYGWDVMPSEPTVDEDVVLELTNPGLKRDEELRYCEVRQLRLPPGLAQAQLNENILRTEAHMRSAGRQITDVEFANLNGVTTVSFRSEAGNITQFSRVFHAVIGNRPTQVFITCSGTSPARERDIQNFQAVLGSLQIGPGAADRAAQASPLPPPPPVSALPPSPLETWRHPEGVFSIGIPEAWRVVTFPDSRTVLHATAPGQPEPQCEISLMFPRSQLAEVDQASLNQVYENRRSADIENELVDGVRVVTVDRTGDRRFTKLLIFLVPFGDYAREFTVQCAISREPAGIHDQEIADAEAMLRSLSFSTRENP